MTDQKKKAPRKRRVDSKEAAVAAMVAEKVMLIEPPADMDFDERQEKVFDEVISEFAKVDWSDHTIRLAASLAMSLWMLQDAQRQLLDEGYTSESSRGTPCINPLVSATNMLSGQVMSLRRTLALHALAGAKTGDVGKRRAVNKGSADDAPTDEDDLIAVPSSPASLRAVK